mmetsp:Transcript_30679/g.51831  ORF Transcript_30679/g.51831 Transcript_30679/m.51831 type:complete len:203 (+) Transcript_30679:298-906(+)
MPKHPSLTESFSRSTTTSLPLRPSSFLLSPLPLLLLLLLPFFSPPNASGEEGPGSGCTLALPSLAALLDPSPPLPKGRACGRRCLFTRPHVATEASHQAQLFKLLHPAFRPSRVRRKSVRGVTGGSWWIPSTFSALVFMPLKEVCITRWLWCAAFSRLSRLATSGWGISAPKRRHTRHRSSVSFFLDRNAILRLHTMHCPAK